MVKLGLVLIAHPHSRFIFFLHHAIARDHLLTGHNITLLVHLHGHEVQISFDLKLLTFLFELAPHSFDRLLERISDLLRVALPFFSFPFGTLHSHATVLLLC